MVIKVFVAILEARITYLAYAPEIAAVMLQRQQASAVVDARAMIVSGFANPVSKELPLEYAVEMNNLIQLEMKGNT